MIVAHFVLSGLAVVGAFVAIVAGRRSERRLLAELDAYLAEEAARRRRR